MDCFDDADTLQFSELPDFTQFLIRKVAQLEVERDLDGLQVISDHFPGLRWEKPALTYN